MFGQSIFKGILNNFKSVPPELNSEAFEFILGISESPEQEKIQIKKQVFEMIKSDAPIQEIILAMGDNSYVKQSLLKHLSDLVEILVPEIIASSEEKQLQGIITSKFNKLATVYFCYVFKAFQFFVIDLMLSAVCAPRERLLINEAIKERLIGFYQTSKITDISIPILHEIFAPYGNKLYRAQNAQEMCAVVRESFNVALNNILRKNSVQLNVSVDAESVLYLADVVVNIQDIIKNEYLDKLYEIQGIKTYMTFEALIRR